MKNIKPIFYFLITIFVFLACNNSSEEIAEKESNFVEITEQQFNTDSMKLGKIESRVFENKVNCNGTIVSLPEGIATVNAPFRGVVRKIYCSNGQFLEQNQPLLEIAGNEIIDIQNEYAEASVKYKRTKSEFERIKSLYQEKVTSEKEFILSEAEFKTALAKYNALKIKIESIGFSTSKIENGDFYSSYTIKSPIGGYVSKLNINIGTYIESQTELLEIINPRMFQIKLSIFANDIHDIKVGQSLRFKTSTAKDFQFATISTIGAAIDAESKSIDCFATILNKEDQYPIANEFIEAEIIINNDSAAALPSQSIIKDENSSLVLVLHKKEDGHYLFKKVAVKTGKHNDDFTEIIDSRVDNLILIKGADNITL